MSRKLLVVGGGGQGRVVIDLALLAGLEIAGVLDDRLPPGANILGLPVLGPVDSVPDIAHVQAVVAIGDNRVRQEISLKLARAGVELCGVVVHPAAIVSDRAVVGRNSVVAAAAVVNVGAIIADGVIVNTGAIVEHDCRVGAYAHICPGARLGGNVSIGERAVIGTGAIVLPGVSVGVDAVVGAGAVVTRDVPPRVTALGVPARCHCSGGETNAVTGIAGGTANH